MRGGASECSQLWDQLEAQQRQLEASQKQLEAVTLELSQERAKNQELLQQGVVQRVNDPPAPSSAPLDHKLAMDIAFPKAAEVDLVPPETSSLAQHNEGTDDSESISGESTNVDGEGSEGMEGVESEIDEQVVMHKPPPISVDSLSRQASLSDLFSPAQPLSKRQKGMFHKGLCVNVPSPMSPMDDLITPNSLFAAAAAEIALLSP